MSTEIMISDFERTEQLETYLYEHTYSLIGDLLPENESRYNLKVKVRESSHRQGWRRPTFECSIQLKLRHRPLTHVNYENANFYQAVHGASLILRKILRKQHATYAHHHRRDYRMAA